MTVVTAAAHPNIALVKYWGKADVAANLPAVPSLSLTLDTFLTRTTVRWSAARDEVLLDDQPASEAFTRRTLRFLDRLAPDRPPCAVHTANSFPTGAGLASSASGFAALTLAASAAAGLDLDLTALSALARQGSGSACRSLYGGLVRWDSTHAEPVLPPEAWPELRMVVAVVRSSAKDVGSTEGMERSRLTSPYYDAWVKTAPADVTAALQAIERRDLPALGAIMEASTFKMHAVMHTSVPPIVYWAPETVAILHCVQKLSTAWLTMDAGPNVKILTTAAHAAQVADAVRPHCEAVWVLGAGRGAWLES